jgi:hypothetical protein
MSGASIASMALAGVFGDLLGIREVFFAASVIVVTGGLLAAVLYRGARGPAPAVAAASVPDSPTASTMAPTQTA